MTEPALTSMLEGDSWISHLRQHAERTIQQFQDKGFPRNTAVQLQAIIQLQNMLQTSVLQDDAVRFSEALAYTLKTDPSHILRIAKLQRTQDIEWALRALQRKDRIYPRGAGDSHLPTSGWIGRYLDWIAGDEIPLGWHFWAALVAFGAACRRNFYVDCGRYTLYLNQYAVLVGSSGGGKSPAIDTAASLVQQMNEVLKDAGNDEYCVPVFAEKMTPEYFLSELTVEPKLIQVGETVRQIWPDSCGLLAPDELVTLLGRDVWHSDMMIHILTAIYSKDFFNTATIKRGAQPLRNVSVSMCGGTTPEWIRRSMTEDMMAGGFVGRTMFISRENEDKTVARLAPADPITRRALADELATFAKAPLTKMDFTPDAARNYESWYAKARSQIPEQGWMVGYLRKRHNHALKIAALLSLAEGHDAIEVDCLERAISVLSYEETRFPTTFQEIGAHPDASDAEFLESLLRGAGGILSRTPFLRKAFHRVGDTDRFDRLLKTLIDQERIVEVAPRAGSGRPRKFYRLVDVDDPKGPTTPTSQDPSAP